MLEEKKITFLISSLAGGGAQGVCVNLANFLAEKGWNITLVVLHLNNSVHHASLSNLVTLKVLNVAHARGSFLPLYNYLKQEKTRRILVFNYELTIILVFIRYFSGLQIKIFARNINNFSNKMRSPETFWLKYLVNPLIRRGYCKIDHIINQCSDMEKDLLSVYPQLKGRTSVIFNPVNRLVERVGRGEVTHVKNDGLKYFLCVGRLEKQKAFHNAINAFAKVAPLLTSFKLKIVGQGSLQQELKELVENLGLQNRVDFEGFHRDIIPFFQGATATLLTSNYEGFPNVLVESITLGTPVISFDCPSGPSEIVQNGINGYLIPHGDVDAFACALEKSIETKWDSLVVKKTAEEFSMGNVGEQYASLLSK